MRILVATLGSYGDVYPFIALASVLKERGHDIALLTNDFFRPLADRLGRLLDSPGVAERCGEIAGRFEKTRPLIEAMLER